MNIGMMHFRTGETDGVSLEMDKWRYVLEKQGHHVIYIAGSGHPTDQNLRIIQELHYKNPINDHIVNKAYADYDPDYKAEKLKNEIDEYAYVIEEKLINIIEDEKIDVLIPNNVLSLGWNVGAGMATAKAIQKTGIQAIAHHHDFHWERELYSSPNYEFIGDMLETYFPPRYENLDHVVINGIAKGELKKRYGIDATIVPNVFDFEGMSLEQDTYNVDMKEALEIPKNAVIFLQATRIVERKGIELAIDVISKMNEEKHKIMGKTLYNGQRITEETEFLLVFAGLNESEDYYSKLLKHAELKGVQVLNINNRIDHVRKERNQKKIYSLWDAYLLADFITYPSLLEGFGNQFLEAIFAKKPLILYEYPVFEDYIKGFGFEYVSLGNEHHQKENALVTVSSDVVNKCADEVINTLLQSQTYKNMIQKNYQICKEYFSYGTLENLVASLVK
ncbi:glycosyltransferase family 4 protein [Vallitalea okinawensis]|uniref:glycosyltransferase family 4 protein n=1 Tax=Vallitalea okinawensis TaxID=2078660 RepID=UPI0014781766|nr:glycosyltransferase family 4 protein [Vallitalea okinawensis]